MLRKTFSRSMSAFEMRRKLISKFKEANVAEPDWSAEVIVAHSLQKEMYNHLTHKEVNSQLPKLTEDQINSLMCKRLNHEPLQYILGEWRFRQLCLLMRPPVFIPRPETEDLVGFVLQELEDLKGQRVLEVGCGSGAISLSLAKESREKEHTFTAIDKNKAAVDLTIKNSYHNKIHQLIESNIFHLSVNTFLPETKLDGIVSNPPYIPTHQMKVLDRDIIDHESHLALDGGKDGLDVVREILVFARKHLKVGGWIWLEVDDSHPGYLSKDLDGLQAGLFTEEELGESRFKLDRVEADLFDRPRFVKLVKV